MKKIAVLSDTHGHLPENVLKYFADCDEIWHAGDVGDITIIRKLSSLKPFKAVYGNIDGKDISALIPENQIFMCESKKILITHIAGKPGKYTARVKKILLDEKPDMLVCGHSHILQIAHDTVYNTLFINPGACGNEGFHKVKTIIRFTIDYHVIKDMQVIELGKRGN
ncbi:MAG: metallophosphoesterase family protein [Cytophagales bacterium]|nr:metallophosphoesterase family protein [Cytophagales bacterium]